MPFSFVKAKIFSGAVGSAKSAGNTSERTLYVAVRRRANSSRRSFRRAVSTRFVPPEANSSASATPIPALAPVMSAHFPDQAAADGRVTCDKAPPQKRIRRAHGTIILAERVGFEPTVRFPARSLSRRVLSTAQPPLRGRSTPYFSREMEWGLCPHAWNGIAHRRSAKKDWRMAAQSAARMPAVTST
jgi:hypothetical protein